MLNRPKFLKPSINMQECCVIDLNSESLPFSCVVDGNDCISAWQIIISRLKDNVVVFDSGKQTLANPFYPVDNRNRNVAFSIDLKKHWNDEFLKKSSAGDMLFVNDKDAYYWNIVLWDSFDNSVLGCEEVFYANSAPEISISYSDNNEEYNPFKAQADDTDVAVLNKRMFYFKGNYNQTEGVGLKKYGWRITDITNSQVISDTISKNQIYGSAGNISCEYNGFVNDFTYMVELYIETQNGYSIVVKGQRFKISYTVKTLITNFDVEALNSSSGIMLDWGNLKTTEGVAHGDNITVMENYPITNYDINNNPTGTTSLKMGKGSMVTFERNINTSLGIPENAYTVLSFQIIDDVDTTLLEMNGSDEYGYEIEAKLSYVASTATLIYTILKTNGDFAKSEHQLTHTPADTSWYIVRLYPLLKPVGEDMCTRMEVVESKAQNALYPSNAIYPTENIHPYNGAWDKLKG